MDNKLEKTLSEKEMFCLSKHIQKLKKIVYSSCSTCKYQAECAKNNFKFEENTLLHLETITNNVCRRYCYDGREIFNISISLGKNPDINKIVEKLCKRLEEATL